MYGLWVFGRGGGGLEAEMVVTMAELRFAAGMDYVDLRGELVGWAEVGFADEGEPRVGVIGDERQGMGEGVLLIGVPDARVTASGCESGRLWRLWRHVPFR